LPRLLRKRLQSGRFALAVGTIENRKNYSLLVDLWQELLPDPEFDLDLVIVGMPGWDARDVMARLEALPLFGSRVLWFKSLSDAGLSWLYEHCLVLLFPSLYEGWGLPVVEALQHCRPVIASNRGATPEAGFGVATILDPDDPAAWRSEVLAACRGLRQVATIEPVCLPTWDDTAAIAKRVIMDLMQTGAGDT
jgi:glycosyltransferase involved in cell wall biosynthesis